MVCALPISYQNKKKPELYSGLGFINAGGSVGSLGVLQAGMAAPAGSPRRTAPFWGRGAEAPHGGTRGPGDTLEGGVSTGEEEEE